VAGAIALGIGRVERGVVAVVAAAVVAAIGGIIAGRVDVLWLADVGRVDGRGGAGGGERVGGNVDQVRGKVGGDSCSCCVLDNVL